MKSFLILAVSLLVLVMVAVSISVYLIGWVIVVWTFQVNALWGIIAAIVWLVIMFLLRAGHSSSKSK